MKTEHFLSTLQGATYQLRTREEYSDVLKKQFASKPKSLSRSAMETLAIIAYRQPITRAEINTIRQVDSSSIVNNLKDRGVIQVAGVRKEPGNPMEYRTTPKFLEVFGLDSLKKLPSLRSLQMSPEEQKDVTTALQELSNSEQSEESSEQVASEVVESMGMTEIGSGKSLWKSKWKLLQLQKPLKVKHSLKIKICF